MSQRDPTAHTETAWAVCTPLMPTTTPGGGPRPTDCCLAGDTCAALSIAHSPPALKLAQLETLDLASRGLGQCSDELNPTRIFVGRNFRFHKILQLGRQVG